MAVYWQPSFQNTFRAWRRNKDKTEKKTDNNDMKKYLTESVPFSKIQKLDLCLVSNCTSMFKLLYV